jgi:hypothetical protein
MPPRSSRYDTLPATNRGGRIVAFP